MPGRSHWVKHWMSQAADSAGIPFEGREFRPHPFAGDDGSSPEGLARALADIRDAITGTDDAHLANAARGLVSSLRTNRVLVPLLAEAGDLGHTPEGRVVEKTQELSIVTVEGPKGEPVGLMFSGVNEMSAWRTDARPIPVEASRVAAWALTEDIPQVVIDPASALPVVCRRGVLWSLVGDEDYVAPWESSEALEILQARDLWHEFSGLATVSVHSGWRRDHNTGPDVTVRLHLLPGLTREDIGQITAGFADHWANHPSELALVDGIHVEVVAAPAE
jgi:hypothetical protein